MPPKATRRKLVLGVADGMSWGEIRPFVASLHRSGFDGDIALLVDDVKASTLQRLLAAGVQRLSARRLKLSIRGHDVHPYDSRLGRLHPFYPRLIQMASRWSPAPELAAAKMAAAISIRDVRRFFVYLLHLAKHGHLYDNVMLSDVRDVIFQANPFATDLQDQLQSFLEDSGSSLASEPHNREWLRLAFGEGVLRELGPRPIVCAGVTIGPTELVQSYLEVMARFLVKLRVQRTGLDQAVHNYILHKGLVPQARLVPNGAGLVATLGIVAECDVDALLRAPVLHQYDRHPAVAQMLLRQIAGG